MSYFDLSKLNARQRKLMNKVNQSLPKQLTLVPEHEWPRHQSKLSRVWRSRHYVVQEFIEDNAIRLSINRVKLLSNGRWDDNLTWDEMQFIKRDCGYGDRLAVEIYPADENVVNLANMRHLWIPDTDLNYGWKNEKV